MKRQHIISKDWPTYVWQSIYLYIIEEKGHCVHIQMLT